MPLQSHLDNKALEELEKQYDSALNTRDNGPTVTKILYWGTIGFALYHLWTAGFGTPVDHVHMGIHLSGLFLFVFTGFPLIKSARALARAIGLGGGAGNRSGLLEMYRFTTGH